MIALSIALVGRSAHARTAFRGGYLVLAFVVAGCSGTGGALFPAVPAAERMPTRPGDLVNMAGTGSEQSATFEVPADLLLDYALDCVTGSTLGYGTFAVTIWTAKGQPYSLGFQLDPARKERGTTHLRPLQPVTGYLAVSSVGCSWAIRAARA